MIDANARRCPVPRLASAAALLFALTSSPHADATIFTVGTDGACNRSTIAAAVADAEANPGPDTIRITRTADPQHWTAQQVVVNTSQDLNIVGGFADCSATVSDGQQTAISGAGGGATSVFALSNTAGSTIKLRLLRITGGDVPGGGNGGGINFVGGGTLEIIETEIDGNHAGYGAGIYFGGNSADATLTISNDVLILGNTAAVSGGGIYLERATMTMTAPGSSIYGNTAVNYGGGLRILGGPESLSARATVGSGGYGAFATIDGNEAQWGGGVAVQGCECDSTTVSADFVLQSADAAHPARISNNFASAAGGGIFLQNFDTFVDGIGDVNAEVYGANLESNSAPQAPAVYIGHAEPNIGNTRGSQFVMSGGRIDGNLSVDDLNHPTASGIIVVTEEGRANLSRVFVQNNIGGPVMQAGSPDDAVRPSLNNSLISGNTITGSVVSIETSGSIDLVGTTIAGNSISGGAVLSVANNITLQRSIVWQPGKQTLQAGGTKSVADVIASELGSLPASATIVSANPRFIDPGHADYHLQAASPGVDFSATAAGSDLDGLPRGIDLAFVPNLAGPADLGAFERQSVGNLVLNPGFAIDLRLWDVFTPNVSSWNSSGANSTGSILVSQTPVASGDLIARTQCVHIPGPGVYSLTGFAYGQGNNDFFRDAVSLRWWFLADTGGEPCAGGISGQGSVTFPNSSTFAASSTPGFIYVSPQQWTPYSSVLVFLVVNERDLNINATTEGHFDGIVLAPAPDLIFADGLE